MYVLWLQRAARPGTGDVGPATLRRPSPRATRKRATGATAVVAQERVTHTPKFLTKERDDGFVPLTNGKRASKSPVPSHPRSPEFVGAGWHTPRHGVTSATLPLSRYRRSPWIDVENTAPPRLTQTQTIPPMTLAALPVIVRPKQVALIAHYTSL